MLIWSNDLLLHPRRAITKRSINSPFRRNA
nr:MAG TPA: hypothetical protein [Bacteriophage sp.]